jgi:hypothetical protein
MERLKISPGLAGVAGEYSVAAELCRRGYLASITLRNAKGVDILATNATASKTAAIQVKTNQGRKKLYRTRFLGQVTGLNHAADCAARKSRRT